MMLCRMLENDSSSTPALQAMASWLAPPLSQAWLAEKLGVSRPTVYRWCAGEHVPDPHYRRAIDDLSKGVVPFDHWYTDEQLAMAYAFSRAKNARLAERNRICAEGLLPGAQRGAR